MRDYPTYYTVFEYAKTKGISTSSVYRAITDGRISPVYVGRSQIAFIPPAALKAEFRAPNKKEGKT